MLSLENMLRTCNHTLPRADPPGSGRGANNPDYRVRHASYVRKSLVSDASCKPQESEFLFAAYSAFEVEEVVWAEKNEDGKYGYNDYHKILIRAANDNKDSTEWPENLPLAPWY